MAREFYIARDEQQYGPFTARELRELGVGGKIRPSDLVWREGATVRIPATQVKGLLSPAGAPQAGAESAATVATAEPRTAEEQASTDSSAAIETAFDIAAVGMPAGLVMDNTEPEKPKAEAPPVGGSADSPISTTPPPPEKPKERPRRVISIRGGKLVSQDGSHVVFRRVCEKCGSEAQGRLTLAIRPGAMKVPYFCRKCRKGRQVEMMGVGG
jgi:hypothetical protein